MRGSFIAAIAACGLLGSAATASADVQLTLQDGRVTLVAKDATLRQILTEWARVGQTRIVNVERVPGGPLTLELRDVSEQQALKVLLRSLGGYVTAARAEVSPRLSMFDRILVMPVTAPPPAPAGAAPAQAPPPPFASFQAPPQFQQVQQDDGDETPPGPVPNPGGNRGPVFVFPPAGGAVGGAQGPQGLPNQPAPPIRGPVATYPGAPTVTAPVGSSAPGMIVPAPQVQQPAVPGTAVQPSAQPGQQVFPAIQPRP
jgi:hypothetical protein